MSAEDSAVRLIVSIARSSAARSENGISFWNGFLRSRIDRHVHRPIREFASRVADECQCDPSRLSEEATRVAKMSTEEADDVCGVIRGQTGLIIALAFAEIRGKAGEK